MSEPKLSFKQLIFKTSVILSGVIFLTTLLLSWVIGSSVRARIEYDQGHTLSDMAHNVADKIDVIVRARAGEIRTLSVLNTFTDPKSTPEQKRVVLNELNKTFPEFAWIGFADMSGHVVASNGGLLEGADISKRPWFIQGKDGDYFGDVHEALLLNKLLGGSEAEPIRFFDFATPIIYQGKVVGVLGAHLSWRWAQDITTEWIEPLQERYPVRLTIYSAEGKVLIGDKSRPKLETAHMPNVGERNKYRIHDLGDGLMRLEGQARTKISSEMDTDGFGWVVVLDRPAKDAFKEATLLEYQILAGGFLFALLFAGVAWRYRTHMTRASKFKREALDAKESEQIALHAAEAKSRFLATMSHEIRTPMNGVMGVTDLLLETKLDDEQKKYAELIKASAESLLSVINDILDYSKVEANKIELERVPFGVSSVLSQVIGLMTFQARHKSVYLKLHEHLEQNTNVMGDPARFRQVIVNLISNALKFTDSGGVDVYITAVAMSGKQYRLRVEVKDSGIGIPESARSKIFQRFEQVDASTSRKYGGTGLGLSISKSLIELMGGEIGFTSEEGKGSTFWFELVLDKAILSMTPVAPVRPARNGKLNILVAEDNSVNQLIIRGMLMKLGHEFTVVENGRLAVEAMCEKDFDLVLMDCHMPEMDGYEATQKIREIVKCKYTPIVAMTASAMADEKERCKKVGMTDYMAKPLNIQTVEGVLQKYLLTAA